MDCIQRLTNLLFKNQKDNLKSIVTYAIEDTKTIDAVLAELIPSYKDSVQLIETAKVLGVTVQSNIRTGD